MPRGYRGKSIRQWAQERGIRIGRALEEWLGGEAPEGVGILPGKGTISIYSWAKLNGVGRTQAQELYRAGRLPACVKHKRGGGLGRKRRRYLAGRQRLVGAMEAVQRQRKELELLRKELRAHVQRTVQRIGSMQWGLKRRYLRIRRVAAAWEAGLNAVSDGRLRQLIREEGRKMAGWKGSKHERDRSLRSL